MARYKYTQESGTDFKVVDPDKADAQEDTNEVRQILDDLGNLLGHNKRDDLYPKDGMSGGDIDARRVTTKSGACTLIVAEAGLILVSASSPWTMGLPTAVGNKGLTYHIVKTDYNYNLITLDAYNAQTLSYPCVAGTPQLTYARLNTYCAEVTIVSDGSNWQVMNERLGQIPLCWAYLADDDQLDLKDLTSIRVEFNAESYDIGSNFDISEWVSGSADENTANHLVDDSESQFTEAMVGCRVKNTDDTTYAYVLSRVDAGDLELSADIFPNGNEAYQIMNAKFVAPIPGYYLVTGKISYKGSTIIADKKYTTHIFNNSATVYTDERQSSHVDTIAPIVSPLLSLSKDDYIELFARVKCGVDTTDISDGASLTNIIIRLISKD